MKYLFLFLISLSTTVHTAQTNIQQGMVTPAVRLSADAQTTHAVYLPRGYDADASYRTIFFFEENGNGAAAVQQFTIAAELTNSIIIAENRAVKDSLDIELQESAAFINAAYERYAINKEEIILAGNGKGALVASSAALVNQNIAGVIAINDVYLDISILKNMPRLKFAILVGDETAQYYKLNKIESLIRNKDFIADFLYYDGADPIPDAGFLQAAVTSILLERTKEHADAPTYYEKDIAYGDLIFKQQKHLAAFEFVNGLKKKYKFHIDDLDEQKELLKTIRRNASFRTKRSQRNAAQEAEYLLAQDLEYYLNEDIRKALFDNLGWWSYQMDDIDATIDSTATNAQERKAAIRLKKYIQGTVRVNATFINRNPQAPLAQKLYVNVLRTLVEPNHPEGFLNAISYSAQEGDEGAALFYLEELLKMGYTDYDTLYELEGTTALRISETYNEIIKAYLGKSKYY